MSPEAVLQQAIMRAKTTPHKKPIETIPIVEEPQIEQVQICAPLDTRRQKITRLAKEWAARHNDERRVFSDVPLIKRAVATYFNIPVHVLEAHRRDSQSVIPRHIAIYLCWQMTNYSCPKIAVHFENRDHTTIMYACNKIAELYVTDWKIRTQVEDIRLLITGMA